MKAYPKMVQVLKEIDELVDTRTELNNVIVELDKFVVNELLV